MILQHPSPSLGASLKPINALVSWCGLIPSDVLIDLTVLWEENTGEICPIGVNLFKLTAWKEVGYVRCYQGCFQGCSISSFLSKVGMNKWDLKTNTGCNSIDFKLDQVDSLDSIVGIVLLSHLCEIIKRNLYS